MAPRNQPTRLSHIEGEKGGKGTVNKTKTRNMASAPTASQRLHDCMRSCVWSGDCPLSRCARQTIPFRRRTEDLHEHLYHCRRRRPTTALTPLRSRRSDTQPQHLLKIENIPSPRDATSVAIKMGDRPALNSPSTQSRSRLKREVNSSILVVSK